MEISAYHRKRNFGVQALTITSCDVWPPFWIFDAEGGGGEKEVYTNLLDDWWKEGGRGKGTYFTIPPFSVESNRE